MGCGQLLKQGVFDEIIVNAQRDVGDELTDWLKRVDYRDFKREQEAGLGIAFPIEGVPFEISGNFSEAEFQNWKTAVDQGRVRKFKTSEVLQIVKRSASKAIIDAWLQCLQLDNEPGLKSALTENGDDVIFTARWIPNSIDDDPPVVTGFQVEGATIKDGFSFPNGMEIPFGGHTIIMKRNGDQQVSVTINTTKGSQSKTIDPRVIVEVEVMPPFRVRIFSSNDNVSPPTSYPREEVTVPPGYKIIGGGAEVHWNEPGNLLIESYPDERDNKWIASSRDSQVVSPATITAWAIALEDPKDEWDVKIFQKTSEEVTNHPSQQVSVPDGYILTGGGAQTHKGGGYFSGKFFNCILSDR